MENFKMNVDRPKISSEEISSKQNFEQVLTRFNQTKPPAYKNPWFWGSAGLASVGLTTILTLNAFTLKKESDDKTITQNNKQLPKDTECIKAPVKNEDIAFTTYKVDPLKDQQIVLESGTRIEIEKGSLLPSDKNTEVEIKVREFHDQASVFVSGIPMDYKKDAFESAGMIEIKGEQNGKEVKINPEKPIEVALKTTTNATDFGFWYLNQDEKSWESYPATQTDITQNNTPAPVEISNKIHTTKNQISSLKKELNAIQQDIATIKTPTKTAYKIPGKTNQIFDLNFDKCDYPELASFENVLFEVVSSNGNDPTFEANSQKKWSDIDLQKNNDKYTAIFKNSKETYRVNVRPVLKGDDLKQAQKEFDAALAESQKTKKNLEQEKAKLELEKTSREKELAKLIQAQIDAQSKSSQDRYQQLVEANENRTQEMLNKLNTISGEIQAFSGTTTFQTTRWGVYNCDKPVSYPRPFPVALAFVWIGNQVAKFKQIFVFDRDKNVRYSFGEGFRSLENFGFNKNNDLVLIGIDFDGNIGYREIDSKEDFKNKQKIEFERKNKETKTVDLLKKLLDETVDAA